MNCVRYCCLSSLCLNKRKCSVVFLCGVGPGVSVAFPTGKCLVDGFGVVVGVVKVLVEVFS